MSMKLAESGGEGGPDEGGEEEKQEGGGEGVGLEWGCDGGGWWVEVGGVEHERPFVLFLSDIEI